MLTGDPAWGEDVADYPWTTGLLMPYDKESRGYVESIGENFPDSSVALFYVNNEFGNVYMDAFRDAADEAGMDIVTEQTVENGDESPPQSQLSALAEAAPDVIMATPLGAQCVTFLSELANVKAANDGLGAGGVHHEHVCQSADPGRRRGRRRRHLHLCQHGPA